MSTTKNAPEKFRGVVKGRTNHMVHVVGIDADEGHEAIVQLDNVKSSEDRPLLLGCTGDVRVFPGQPPFFRPDRSEFNSHE